MKKILAVAFGIVWLCGCVPASTYKQPTTEEYNRLMDEAKRKDAEFERKVKNINLETADVGVNPKNYKQLIENAIKNDLKDPESARFYDFTAPKREVMIENGEFVYGYASCVFVNAKNSYGGYIGKQLFWIFYRDNNVLRIKNTNDEYGMIIFRGRPIRCN